MSIFNRYTEINVARLCDLIWQESPQNHVCGLLEETVEVAHASGLLSKEQCLQVLHSIVDRVYAESVPDHNQQPAALFGELKDVMVMLSCVRQQTPYLSNECLTMGAAQTIDQLFVRWQKDPSYFANKLQLKQQLGLRLTGDCHAL